MNAHYIAGFFDADGYITLAKHAKTQEKTPMVGFTNNVREILEKIQEFLYKETGTKGYISLKRARRDTHNDSFDLKYQGILNCTKVLSVLPIIHPKKVARFALLPELQRLTPRNGKYRADVLQQRRELCQRFLEIE
jgi:intein-encoded DNA endonuclease-like protein